MRNWVKSLLVLVGVVNVTTVVHAQQKIMIAGAFSADNQLLVDAKKEGKVAFWCPYRAEECSLISNRFEELTRIKVDFVRLSGGPALTRISQERAAKIYSVDVLGHADQTVWENVYKKKGFLQKYTPEGVTHYAPEYRDPDGYYNAAFLTDVGIAYNTDLIPAAEAPKSYAELALPKYKGKIAMPHLNYSGSFGESVAIIRKLLGNDYMDKLKSNDVLVKVGSQYTLNPLLASGERAVAIQATVPLFMDDIAKKKPVAIVHPIEGTIVNPSYAGLVANAPHPAAGKLFLEWLHSAELQTMLAKDYWLMPHPDTRYPAGRPTLKDLKILVLPLSEAAVSVPAAKAHFNDLFGR